MRTFFYDGNNFLCQDDEKISILLDSAPRSGNQFLNEIVYAAFPTIHQQWGANCIPHNIESFELYEDFDLIVAVVRNPIDSIASSMLVFDAIDEEKINEQINSTLNILKAINKNKDKISIFLFEDVINNIDTVLLAISEKLKIQAESFDLNRVMSYLLEERNGKRYATPVNNNEELANAKLLLNQPIYAESLNNCISVYNEIKGK
jgi:hypothetical protein